MHHKPHYACTCSSITERSAPVIGFCFSFPVEQNSVNSGKLLRWTKGYNNPGAIGSDPAKLLTDAFKRRVCSLLHSKEYPAYTDLQELVFLTTMTAALMLSHCAAAHQVFWRNAYMLSGTQCAAAGN